MKKKNENIQDQIELRSEKVRKLIGEIPPLLIRWGMVIIIIIFSIFIGALIFMPFPNGEQDESIFKYIIRNLY